MWNSYVHPCSTIECTIIFQRITFNFLGCFRMFQVWYGWVMLGLQHQASEPRFQTTRPSQIAVLRVALGNSDTRRISEGYSSQMLPGFP